MQTGVFYSKILNLNSQNRPRLFQGIAFKTRGTYGAEFRDAISYKHDTPLELKMADFPKLHRSIVFVVIYYVAQGAP
jgi:hypothetical protein